ncbi:hypothetical protein CBR_g30447 [Chara braunii]|uniref:Core Histone H2A/H2B/H3 domain-containing protein n=1 Tax=Chara braunii TaxID=69332 RepID=A0A388LCQ6_CHABU|nr:hypothetical protein CBR_g30447 [Chara braunii]|eukprot:GBG80080.1 hypothetical protein CBR_g30447 [Chara braunii]
MESAIATAANAGETNVMETEVILSGRSPASEVNETTVHQQTVGGGTATAAWEEVFATIHMETEQMLADVDDNESGARGNSAQTEKVGGERDEEDVGSEGHDSGCVVTDANATKTMAGDRYPYGVNWVPGRVQPGIVGGVHCFVFKVADEWVAVPAPKKGTWRNVCLSFIYDRVLRSNDGATTHDACQYVLEMYRVLQAKGELRLNDFVYDNFDCGQLEATADEKEAMTCRPRDARIFDPPLGNPVELALVEGMVFSGEKRIIYVHVRGKEATFDGICMDIWDHVAMWKDVVAASNIAAHVIQEGQLYQHVARDMYGYHVNWVPGSLYPALVDDKVTLGARMQSGEWLPLGWMHAGVVEHWQFLVVVTRVSVCNPHVKDRGLLQEHAQRCWEKIREEERQTVCMGYDSHNDQAIRSIVEDSCTEQARPSTDDMFLEGIRCRHGCTSFLGWVPVVYPMTYEHGEQMCMRFRDPLGVPFQVTYIDGLLRHIKYVGDDDARAASNAQQTTQQQQDISHLATQVDGPETANDGGCSNAKPGDGDTPAEHVTRRAEKKKKQCTSRPPRRLRSSTKAKGKEKDAPDRDQTSKAAAAPVQKRRRRPGMAALAEIRQLQRSTQLCITLRPFMRVVREVVEKEIAPGKFIRFQMNAIRALLEAAEAYLINHFERTNIIAIHCKRVTIQLKDLKLVENLAKARWVYKYEGIIDEQKKAEKLRQMNAARQVEREAQAGKGVSEKTSAARKGGDIPAGSSKKKGAPPLEEVMQYAEEGIHYNDDGELQLLTKRVPSYFDVRVNIRASIAANGEESLRARMLLARFTEAQDLHVDNSADTGAYSLRKVVGWMCTKGMSDEGDVDMTKQQKGETYTPVDFKQMLMTQAKKWEMLVEDFKDEMKSGAREILLLSRLKDIPQAPPQDFQDLLVIIANEVEYVLLDQLVDFMKKKPDDRNVIHEALHDVIDQALVGKDLINYRVWSVDEDVVCGTLLWDEIFMAALHRLSIATSEVDRKRSTEEGWKLVAREADVALHAADGHTSAGEEIVRTVSIVRSPINTMSTEEVEKEDVFNEWTMTEQQRERGFEDSSLPINFEYDIEETRVRNNKKDARVPSYEVEVSGSDVSSDEEGEEYDAYWDMEAGGGQASKGWAHAILRLTRHNVETVSCLEIQPSGEGINICGSRTGQLSHHVQTVIRADKGVDTNGKTRYVIPLSLYSDKTHVDGRQKQTPYPLMMSIADRASDATLLAYLPVLQHRPRNKGWGLHAIAFRKRKAVILHKALSIVLRSAKEASHDGMIVTTERFGEITVHPFVMNYIEDYPERCALATVKFDVCPICTVSKDDFDVIADFTNCRRSQTLEMQIAANCFNNGDNNICRAAEARMSELKMHKHVQENGLWGFYRG